MPQRLEQLSDKALERGRARVGQAVLGENALDDLADRPAAVDVLDEWQLSLMRAGT